MARKYNVLVFPCGSEIGLEIHRSLKYATQIQLYGASSIADHGKFVYENYSEAIPFIDDKGFIPAIKDLIKKKSIDVIYPAMDSVITKLAEHVEELGCKVIASPLQTTHICLSKRKTYEHLKKIVNVPAEIQGVEGIMEYPVFLKPEVGYGSRGAKLIKTKAQALTHLSEFPESMILEYLPGEEVTVDCFTNYKRELLFSGPRKRRRVMNGISVNTTVEMQHLSELQTMALKINDALEMRGAWFFQIKQNKNGEYVLLEVASRLAGSSSIHRNLGVNFALLSIFDAFEQDVRVFSNDFRIELDRALDNKYKVNLDIKHAYIDFDDCLIVNGAVNIQLIALLYQFLNEGAELTLITKHDGDIEDTLARFRLRDIFHQIIHIEKDDFKYKYMRSENAIFIDDSFAERYAVYTKLGIPVFAPDSIECLLNIK